MEGIRAGCLRQSAVVVPVKADNRLDLAPRIAFRPAALLWFGEPALTNPI